MKEQEKAVEITCRNCEESFSVPESALTHPDVPCPKCGFINHLTRSGTFSKPKILAKLAIIFGDGIDDESQQGIASFFIGGKGLILVVILVIIYLHFTSGKPADKSVPTISLTATNSAETIPETDSSQIGQPQKSAAE